MALAAAPAAEPPAEGKVTVSTIAYGGWKNNLLLANGKAELVVTLDVGPRVISYELAGGPNVFKESASELGKSGEAEWKGRGGHRLWTAPEDLTRTYAPDNGPVAHKQLSDGTVRLTPAPDKEYGIQKELDVTLDPGSTRVKVVHRITNVGKEPTELAPWALTVMDAGGVEVIPLPPKRPHPGSPKNAKSPADFAPNVHVMLWPFFDFKDPRYGFGSKFITLSQDGKRGATKIGLAHKLGWIGYLNKDCLFVKRFDYQEGANYPDGGVNFETFTNEDMLEMETLGPLVKLAHGKSVEHVETWELFRGVKSDSINDAALEKAVTPLISGGK
jgi:hypothetical protein